MDTRELEKKIRERKEKIKIVAFFVEEAVNSYRKDSVVEKNVESSHVKTTHEFVFGNFFFYASYNQCMMGGNTIKVWNKTKKIGEPVLSFYYQDDLRNGTMVTAFNEDSCWWSDFEKMISSRHEIVRLELDKETEAQKAARKKKEEAQKIAELKKEAEKWGIQRLE